MTSIKTIGFAFLVLTIGFFSCNKEKYFKSEVIGLTTDSTDARIEADFELKGNNNYLYVGICWSKSPNPTIGYGNYQEGQKLNSGTQSYFVENLDYATNYYVRSFIKKFNSDEIIYSDDFAFLTADVPTAPCETEIGELSFSGSNYSMSDLSETTFDDSYTLSTSCSFGELDFKFNSKPSKNSVYKTVNSTFDFTENTVMLSGVLGMGFSCFYRAGNNANIYVEVTESDAIIIRLCDVKMNPSGSCEFTPLLTGAVATE